MYDKKNPPSINDLFDNISRKYDFMNNLMSFFLHKNIKKHAVNKLEYKDNLEILDLCTGTGDIAILLAEKYKNSHVTGIDFSEKMLEIAKNKSKNLQNIEFKKIDINNLSFKENSFDICFISFGLRNLPDINLAINNFQKILKPDGIISILDLGKPNGIIKFLYGFYFNRVIPFLGKLFNKNKTPYQYLVESLSTYPSQDKIIEILNENGFYNSKNANYIFGIIAQQTAQKKGRDYLP